MVRSTANQVGSVGLAVVPVAIDGVSRPVISLNGQWQFNEQPPEEFWTAGMGGETWEPIQVPGEPAMQGFRIKHNVEYAYKRTFAVPADFAGKKVILRFDGVYSYARVWVNGLFVRDHHGGFTSWDCNITPFVRSGDKVQLTVGVIDCADDISFASGYAKHRIGGILRDVSLICLPPDSICRFDVETDLDEQYRHAALKVDVAAEFTKASRGFIQLKLTDPNESTVTIVPERIELTHDRPCASVEIPVKKPRKWDAEHPYLYTLEAEWIVGGQPVESVIRHVGFRQVEVQGNRLLVNGMPVKLRGACRHDIHPTLGRMTTRKLDERDARLAFMAGGLSLRPSAGPRVGVYRRRCRLDSQPV